MSTTSALNERMDARAWGVLLVLAGAVFLEGVDVAMLNVALPAIRADLGLSTGTLSGVVSAYVLGYGGFMLLGGRAADLLGRRRMFLSWLVVFLLFSGLGGFASEGWMLLLARFVTGVAAAFMAPAGLALLIGAFPEGPRRTKALGVYAGTAAGGFSLGLVVGGLLTSVGWRWVFFAPVLLAAVILVAALLLIKEADEPERPEGGFDLPGAFSITGAMLLLVYGVVRLEHSGNGMAGTLGVFAAGFALLAAFVAIERRSPDPLVRLGILRSAPFVRANLGALLFIGSFMGFQFLATLYLQEVRGWSPLQTGLAMLVVGVDTVLAPTLTPRLVNRFGNVPVLFGGMVLAVLAYLLFLPLGMDWTYAAMLPTMVLLGLAFSLAYGPLTMAATEGVDEREEGLASGIFYTSIQFGTALGVSAVTAVNVAALGDATAPAAKLDSLQAALLIPLAAAVAGAVITAFGLRGATAPERPEPVRVPV
ncbi:MFS transporter [Actinocorallia populi]|uniref:MFS transporter n=1 Tax=Actinocorallia populi TaxID=2079200 RepID=UPI001E39C021|nr:MFS transporter [Actinocorallia populi]